MKKLTTIIVVALLSFGMMGCSSSTSVPDQSSVSESQSIATKELTLKGLTLKYPDAWTTKTSENGEYWIYPTAGGLVQIGYNLKDGMNITKDSSDNDVLSYSTSFIDSALDHESFTNGTRNAITISTRPNGKEASTTVTFGLDGTIYKGYIALFFVGSDFYSVLGALPQDSSEADFNELRSILSSITVENYSQSSTSSSSSSSSESSSSAAPTPTKGQLNALKKAESYLNYSAFSRAGLIDQLEYEGFSTEDATYAVDNVKVDWNEQAVKKANSYLSYSSFSRQGLIDQLEYEGFTPEQAEYGVSQAYDQ